MKISLNWLQNFIELTEKDNDKIKSVITANTAEIETMEKIGNHLDNIVVGKIEKIWAHPNADTLKLCSVNDGNETFQVVCGGSNLREGMKVAFGRIGAVVRWHGTEVVKLEKAKIRGQESFGMICASDEIGLTELFPKKAEKEIVDLSHLDTSLGTPLAKALGLDDVLIDIDNHALTNRADLFSHRGFALEFVANNLGKWKKQKPFRLKGINTPSPITLKIQDKKICSRYVGVYVTNVEVAESPDWMKRRLSACNIRPINNLVDVTNYVMLELGMPLHTFDLDQVKGKAWMMRSSKKGEKVVTLDQTEHELPDNVIVLDDGHELFDLCGIMGGYQSGIKPHTNRIWLHAPVYHPILIRRASRALNHLSEASIIYEKGVDDELALKALERCIELIQKLCPQAKVASAVMDMRNKEPEIRKLTLRNAQLRRLVGCEIKPKDVKRILERLGFKVAIKKGGYGVTIPSWRMNDIKIEADLIEEIARIYGYDNIPFTTPITAITPVNPDKRRVLEREIKEKLVTLGFDEIYTFAFLGPELLKKCGLGQSATTIEIANPISSDISLMRQSLLPRMLETVEQTWRHEERFKLFELSKTYFKKGNDAEERSALILSTCGEDFRVLQGLVEALGITVEHVTGLGVIPAPCPVLDRTGEAGIYTHPGRRALLTVRGPVPYGTGRGQKVGWLYEVHPQVLKTFDIKARVAIAEIDLEAVHAMQLEHRPKFQELPRFPSVKLDVSIAIPKKELAAKVFELIAKTDKTLIDAIELIDEYEGEKVEQGQRGLTYSITYRAKDRTLTEEEVYKVHDQVLQNLKNSGATIRV